MQRLGSNSHSLTGNALADDGQDNPSMTAQRPRNPVILRFRIEKGNPQR